MLQQQTINPTTSNCQASNERQDEAIVVISLAVHTAPFIEKTCSDIYVVTLVKSRFRVLNVANVSAERINYSVIHDVTRALNRIAVTCVSVFSHCSAVYVLALLVNFCQQFGDFGCLIRCN